MDYNILVKVDLEKIIAETIIRSFGSIYSKAKKRAKDFSEKLMVDIDLAFKSYLKTAYQKYSRIKTIIYRDLPMPIYDFYEHLDLKSRSLKSSISTKDIENLFSLINKNVIAVTGIAGSGKSTLLKHLFLNAIDEKYAIPVYVELRHMKFTNEEFNLTSYILDQMNNLKLNLEMSSFEYALNWGKFVILFDGYDEIAPNNRPFVLKSIIDFCTKYDNNDYILTSRPTDDFINSQFIELSIMPLSKPKSISLINKISISSDEELNKQAFLGELDSSLYDSHKSFAENPMLLVLMLIMYREYSEIPEKLHLFYAQAYETLYCRHDSTKGGFRRPMFCNISSDVFKSILEAFSFVAYTQNTFSFGQNFIQSTLNTVKRILAVNISKEFSTQDFLNDLLQSVTVLIKDGETFTFIHRSFQEYFSACYIQQCSDIEQKKVLNAMFDPVSNRRLNDSFFSMLFDLDKERITSNFLIDKLLAIKKATKYEDNYDKFTGVDQFLININSTLWFGIPQQQLIEAFLNQVKKCFITQDKLIANIGIESFYVTTNRNYQYIDVIYFAASRYLEEFSEDYAALLSDRNIHWDEDQSMIAEKIGWNQSVEGFAGQIAKVKENRCMSALSRQDITIINFLFAMSIIDRLTNKASSKMRVLNAVLGKYI